MEKKQYEKPSIVVYDLPNQQLLSVTSPPSDPGFGGPAPFPGGPIIPD